MKLYTVNFLCMELSSVFEIAAKSKEDLDIDVIEWSREREINERQVREALYKLQEVGYPISHIGNKKYRYHYDKTTEESREALIKEAKSKRKSALTSLTRYWGIVKSLSPEDQTEFKTDIDSILEGDHHEKL